MRGTKAKRLRGKARGEAYRSDGMEWGKSPKFGNRTGLQHREGSFRRIYQDLKRAA